MKIVVIGSSTGGPKALDVLFSKLPADFPAPVMVAQHLTREFTASLAKRLDSAGPLTVSEAEEGQVVERGQGYVIPGDQHFFFTRRQGQQAQSLAKPGGQASPDIRIHLLPAKELPKPSIDMGFTSCAEHFGPQTIGVILSGMGEDGLIGANAIKQLGGKILVQDEPTSVVFGMGRRVVEAGLADEVLPLEKIAGRLVELIQNEK